MRNLLKAALIATIFVGPMVVPLAWAQLSTPAQRSPHSAWPTLAKVDRGTMLVNGLPSNSRLVQARDDVLIRR